MTEIITTEEMKPVRSHVIIAAEINSIKEQTRKIVLFNAIEIGRRLVEAKEVVAHGEWANWLKDSVDFSQSTANNMMRLFEEFGANQIALFDDNIKSQTFGNLSYSQAVKLLAIPEEEREEFIQEHDVENISVRELDKVIKEKQELEKKLKEVEDEKESVDESLEDLTGAYGALQEELISSRNQAQEQIDSLNKQLSDAKASGASDEKVKELEEQLAAANDSLVKTDEELDAANKKIEELERKLKEKPIEVPVTTTVEVVPEDIQKELDELREKNKQLEAKAGQSPTIKKFEVCFETLTTSFSNLLGALEAVKASDDQEHEKYKNAVKKLIGIMTERLA